MNRTRAEAWLLPCLLLLLPVSGFSAQAQPAQAGAQPGTQADDTPSVELLEFLGGFETPEGEWFDPLQLADRPPPQTDPKVTGDD